MTLIPTNKKVKFGELYGDHVTTSPIITKICDETKNCQDICDNLNTYYQEISADISNAISQFNPSVFANQLDNIKNNTKSYIESIESIQNDLNKINVNINSLRDKLLKNSNGVDKIIDTNTSYSDYVSDIDTDFNYILETFNSYLM